MNSKSLTRSVTCQLNQCIGPCLDSVKILHQHYLSTLIFTQKSANDLATTFSDTGCSEKKDKKYWTLLTQYGTYKPCMLSIDMCQ